MKYSEGYLLDDRYLFERFIGSGTFGEVWVAIDKAADIEVAIKVYVSLDEEGLQEFKKEFPSIGCVELIHYPDNHRAAAVYERAGFKLTGDRVESAPGRIERDSTDINRTYEITRRRYY